MSLHRVREGAGNVVCDVPRGAGAEEAAEDGELLRSEGHRASARRMNGKMMRHERV